MEVVCHHCNSTVEPVPPSKKWKVAVVLAGVSLLVLAPLFGGIVGLSLVLVPILLAIGMMVGPIARMATEWKCPECDGEIHPPEPVREAHATRARRRFWHRPHPT
jgi:hypothetical protein